MSGEKYQPTKKQAVTTTADRMSRERSSSRCSRIDIRLGSWNGRPSGLTLRLLSRLEARLHFAGLRFEPLHRLVGFPPDRALKIVGHPAHVTEAGLLVDR